MNEQAVPSDLLQRLGLKVGHYTDEQNLTGLTAFITEKGADLGIDIRGSNTGTFNTPSFDPKAAWSDAHAIVLTGGSTFGLSSAVGVMKKLTEQGIGAPTRAGIIPGATGAVIYDIAVGQNVSPSEAEGMRAVEGATNELPAVGNVGVGTGATLGKWFKGTYMKGGFGIGISYLPHDIIVAAFTVVNALGDAVNAATREFYSESGQYRRAAEDLKIDFKSLVGTMNISGNTTLTVIATNAAMDKNQLMKVAEFTHDGYARALHPIHTNMDGDVVFALSSKSSERITVDTYPATVTDMVGIAAQDAVVAAINNAVKSATSVEGIKSYSDIYGK